MTISAPSELLAPDMSAEPHVDRRHYSIAVILALITFAIFAKAISYKFIGLDDYEYVVNNTDVTRGLTIQSLKWSLKAIVGGNYSPLTMWVELLISSVFGTGAGGYHFANILLHSANVGLAFLFLRYAGVRNLAAIMLAAAWGWHPLRVESVAWVSELKDVLCTFFWLCTLLAYVRYTRSRRSIDYFAVLLLYTASLAAKPMATTLPFVLLLLDYYPLRRFELKKLISRPAATAVAEKLPMLLLAAALSRVTLNVQNESVQHFAFSVRLSNSAIAVADYLRDTLWPVHLSVFYPHPAILGQTIASSHVVIAAAILLAISSMAVWLSVTDRPGMLVGWFWFLGTLVPVIGLVQVGAQSRADRYTYIPTLGLILAAGWGLSSITYRRSMPSTLRFTSIAVGTVLLIVLATVTERQLSFWRDSDTLFLHANAVTENNYLADAELANIRMHDGRAVEALQLANKATAITVDKFTLVTQGLALVHLEKNAEALKVFARAMRLYPKDPIIRRHAANLLSILGRQDEAEKQFKKAIELAPEDAITRTDYGSMLIIANRQHDAQTQWLKAVELDPTLADAQAGLAQIDYREGQLESAKVHFESALKFAKRPIKPQWEIDYAWLQATSPMASTDEIDDALARATDAVPNVDKASALELDTLAAAMARAGRFNQAATVAEKAAERAESAGNASMAGSIRNRMRGYQNGQPYIIPR